MPGSREVLLRRIKDVLSTGSIGDELRENSVIQTFLRDPSSEVSRETKTYLLCESIRLGSVQLGQLALTLNGNEVYPGLLKLAFNGRGAKPKCRVALLDLLLSNSGPTTELGEFVIQEELACTSPCFEVIPLLVGYRHQIGANVDAPVKFSDPAIPSMSPLFVALFNNAAGAVEALLTDDNINEPLPDAVYDSLVNCGTIRPRSDCLFWDEQQWQSEDKPLAKGAAPLTLAMMSGSRATVQVILDRGPDLSCVNALGKTALDVAYERQRILYIRMLIQRLGVTVTTMSGSEVTLDVIPAGWIESAATDVKIDLKALLASSDIVEHTENGYDLALLDDGDDDAAVAETPPGRKIAKAGRRNRKCPFTYLPGNLINCNELTRWIFDKAAFRGYPISCMVVYRD